jgi:hypothetical protein
MNPQFSLKTLLLATAVVSLLIAAPLLAVREFAVIDPDTYSKTHDPLFLVKVALVLSPLWLPLVFVGYAIGRRSITARFMLCLAVSEALAFCVTWLLFPYTKG